jgi:hypothetical protein
MYSRVEKLLHAGRVNWSEYLLHIEYGQMPALRQALQRQERRGRQDDQQKCDY